MRIDWVWCTKTILLIYFYMKKKHTHTELSTLTIAHSPVETDGVKTGGARNLIKNNEAWLGKSYFCYFHIWPFDFARKYSSLMPSNMRVCISIDCFWLAIGTDVARARKKVRFSATSAANRSLCMCHLKYRNT